MRLLPLAIVVALLSAAAPASGPQAPLQPPADRRPVFRANTQLVSVDVIVRDGSGAVVRGLTAADFEVLEDGKPQEIRSFSFEEISDHPKGVESAELLAGAQERLISDSKRPAPAAASEGRREVAGGDPERPPSLGGVYQASARQAAARWGM